MANLKANITTQTKAGIFVRKDPGQGLLVYSPFSGLFFACHEQDSNTVVNWLNKKTVMAPSAKHQKALGPGWATDAGKAEYPLQHLLATGENAWPIPYPKRPFQTEPSCIRK